MKKIDVKILIGAFVILLSQSCTSKVEIPSGHVGIFKNSERGNVLVLKPGEHLVSFGSEVIVFDVRPENLGIQN